MSRTKSAPKDEIFVLGFDGSFSECLINFTGIENAFRIREFENSFQAFRWLEEKVAAGDNAFPKAIICEFEFLEEEKFLLLHNLQSHPVLRYIPCIAMNRDGLNHKLTALQLGFDDYYDVPVHWRVLKDRVEFLTNFKKEVLTCELEPQENLGLRLSFVKRALDVAIASIALLALTPLLLLIAILIKMESRGPVVYRSKRVGTGYRLFDFLKFRSMYKDADKRLNDLQHLNQYVSGSSNGGMFLKFNNDPRVTFTGRLIRKTSLDELPQLINVLKGDMSIVGNRPLPVYEAELLTKDAWAERFLAPAGLTGLWQVTKRGKKNMSSEERIKLDVTYARRHSFWYDLKIIMRTLPAMIQSENV
jgi:lipopolysaccharide/colanic/teichoic acid biosynthesis glycosyltransferase